MLVHRVFLTRIFIVCIFNDFFLIFRRIIEFNFHVLIKIANNKSVVVAQELIEQSTRKKHLLKSNNPLTWDLLDYLNLSWWQITKLKISLQFQGCIKSPAKHTKPSKILYNFIEVKTKIDLSIKLHLLSVLCVVRDWEKANEKQKKSGETKILLINGYFCVGQKEIARVAQSFWIRENS